MRPPPAVVKHFDVSLRHSPQKGYDVACAVCKQCGKKYPTIDVRQCPSTCWKAASVHAGRCSTQVKRKLGMQIQTSNNSQGHAVPTLHSGQAPQDTRASSSRPRLVFTNTRRVLQPSTAPSSMLTRVDEQDVGVVSNQSPNKAIPERLFTSPASHAVFEAYSSPPQYEQSPINTTVPRLLDEFIVNTRDNQLSYSHALLGSPTQSLNAAQNKSRHVTATIHDIGDEPVVHAVDTAVDTSPLNGMCMSHEEQEQLVGPYSDESASCSSSDDQDQCTARPTSRHYSRMLSQPVDPANRPQGISTAQLISLLAWWQCRHNTSNVAMDDMIKIISNAMLRNQANTACKVDDHNVPPSRYIISKVIGQKDQQSIQYHICQCFKYAWPPFRGNYSKLINQCCPKCASPRVVQTKEASQGKQPHYKPKHCFWFFGVQEGIKTYLFGNKDWALHRATDAARQNTFYTSRLADQLRHHPGCGQAIDDRNTSVYVIGIDWFQPFTYKQHSVGVIFLKCLDFEDRFQGVGTNIFPLMILEGPKEPSSIQVHLGYIAQEFTQFGPKSNGFEVVDASTQETLVHRIILGGVLGDTPARQKVAGLTGHSAKMGCPYCVSNATKIAGYSAAYWRGFSHPVAVNIQQVIRFDDNSSHPYRTTAKICDPRVHCNSELIKLKANLAEQYKLSQGTNKLPSPNPFGAHMHCTFTRVIPYFDLETMLVIPASHGMLRGIGYDLWLYIFSPTSYKPKPPNTREVQGGQGKGRRGTKRKRKQCLVRHISHAAKRRLEEWEAHCPPDYDTRVWFNGPIITPSDKKLIAARGQQIRRNCDLPTPYKCIVAGDGKLGTMDEYLNFFDCYAPLVLRDVLLGSTEFTSCVGNLMQAIAWFLRPPSREDLVQYEELLNQYHEYILDYGRFIETHGLPQSLLKVSLHIMACQLKQQCKARGHLAADNELFIERAIQSIKNKLRGRSTQFPEKVLSNTLLLKLASTNFRMLHECATFQELTGRGMEREIYEIDMGTSVSDDKPEREYFTGRGSWAGQRQHRLSGQGHKLQLMDRISQFDKAQLMHALHMHLLQQKKTRKIDLQTAMIEDFKEHAMREHRIRLHTGAFLSHGEMVLSVAHGRERINESCWTLARIKLRHGGSEAHDCVVRIIRFVFCRLSGGQGVDWLPPPYRAAVGIIYHTDVCHTPFGVLYKVDLQKKLNHAGQATISLDLAGKKQSSREHVSILNLDHVLRKVASVPDDEQPSRFWWFAPHSARSGCGFWEED